MDKSTWNSILIAAVPLVLGFSVVTLVLARPRSQVLLPFLPSLAASCAIYPAIINGVPDGHGASGFHMAFVVCISLALGLALVLIMVQPWRHMLATFSWAFLGVVTPYVLFFALLAWTCRNGCELG